MSNLSKEYLVSKICNKLTKDSLNLREAYKSSKSKVGVCFFYLDDLLPKEDALEIYKAFQKEKEPWRLMDSFREKKYTSKNFEAFPKILENVTFALQDRRVIAIIEEITGIGSMDGDPTLYAGGLSMMNKGHFLGPHIDNSHNQERTSYRRLNLLYYVTPDWKKENGGHLNLWDREVKTSVEVESYFNRLVVMETTPWSWHSVSKVKTEGQRCCVSNYFFSQNSTIDREIFHVTSFQALPEEKFMRVICTLDNKLRSIARLVKKNGFGQKDVYEKK